MSGISGISGSSGTSSSLFSNSLPTGSSGSSSSLPNGGLSSVGASLLSTGAAPNPVAPTAPAASPNTISSYQAEYLNLQQYDNQELLYASFLSPEAGLANFDSVLEQAAQLLGTPGSPGPALAVTPTSVSPTTTSTSGTSTTPSTSTSSTSSALTNLPSIASILAASDDEAQQTLNAYANAPVGSSILDYQA